MGLGGTAEMSRNLYILSGTLLFFAVASYVLATTGIAHQPGSPADASLWRSIGIVLLLLALVVMLIGVLQRMFEQAERRVEDERARAGRDPRGWNVPGPRKPRHSFRTMLEQSPGAPGSRTPGSRAPEPRPPGPRSKTP